MTEKETVAQMLRRWRSERVNPGCEACRELRGSLLCPTGKPCCDAWGVLADRIEAEVGHARVEALEKSFCEGIAWRIANLREYEHLPKIKDGEDVAQWLDRCFLRLPLVDGEPLAKGMMLEGCADPVDGYCVYEDGSGSVFNEDSEEIAMIREYDCSERDNSLHLKSTEVLDADGVPIKVGDTVWVTPEHEKDCGRGLIALVGVAGLCGVEYGRGYDVIVLRDRRGNVVLDMGDRPHCPASWLTHKEPDSLEKLRDDMVEVTQPTERAHEEFIVRLTALIEMGDE